MITAYQEINMRLETLEHKFQGLQKTLYEKASELERTLNVLISDQSELESALQASLTTTYNRVFLWHIPEVRQRIQDTKMGRILSIYSLPFYSGRYGYKMCIRAYLNGDGSGKGTHLTIFLVIMKSEYDTLCSVRGLIGNNM